MPGLRTLPLKDAALEALYLTHPERVAEYMVVADMGDSELGLVFVDGKLADLVGPGERAFYARLYRDVRVQIIDLAVEVDRRPNCSRRSPGCASATW